MNIYFMILHPTNGGMGDCNMDFFSQVYFYLKMQKCEGNINQECYELQISVPKNV